MATGLGLGFLTVEGPFAGQLQEPHQAAPVGGCLDKRAEGCTMLHPSCARNRKVNKRCVVKILCCAMSCCISII